MRTNRSLRKIRSLAVLAVVALLALGAPAAAIAQAVSPTDEQYDRTREIGISDEPDSAPQVPGDNTGELPFTGLDLAAIAAIGIGLAGGGFVVRRAARAGTDS